MSWTGYTDNLKAQGFQAAWILDVSNGSVWAEDSSEKITPEQVLAISKAFTNSSDVMSSGVRVGGNKFFYLQSDDKQLQCKQGKGGFTAAKSGKCIVAGQYDDKLTPGSARNIVEKLRDYLSGAGY